MARQSRHTREELRELIVQAALELVSEDGAEQVTARRIAKAIGYTPGMLYTVFTNLREIFLHVNAASLETLYADCVAARDGTEEPEEALQAVGLAYLEFAERHRNQFDLLFQRHELADLTVPESLTARIRALFDLAERELATLAPSVDEATVRLGARALWSGVHGTAALALTEQLYLDGEHVDRAIVTTHIERFVDGWRERV